MEPNREGRGQTTLDLLVGVSVFLVTAGFVIVTASGMVDPYVGDQEQPLVADRTTALLVEGMFVTGGEPGTLNETCTYGFFDETLGEGTCMIPYDETESDITERLGLTSWYSVNVTIRRNTTGDAALDVLCTDGDVVQACSAGGTRLSTGAAPPDSGSVFSASRAAFLDGREVVVEVVLW